MNRHARFLTFAASVFALLALFAIAVPGQAQQLGDALQQLQQQRSGNGNTDLGQPAVPPQTIFQPVQRTETQILPQSRLEQILSQRAGAKLLQFGYDQLGFGSAVTVPQTGAVQDDYVLGTGDEIVISLRGAESNEYRQTVDRNGQVTLPRLSPISATGRTVGAFRQDLDAAVRRAYVATNTFVSIGRMRQISVLVSGEVNAPGQRQLTGLSSVVDAILLSGGVRKSGSLRNVRILRNGREQTVDLYSVITGSGTASNLRLADGDRIIVPTLGPTVAVSGLVRRPGIFELPRRSAGISTRALLELAGGPEVRGLYRFSILRIDADGRNSFVTVNEQTGQLSDGEILFVQLGANQVVNQATLSGGSGLAGAFTVTPGTRLSAVLRAPGAMGNTPYSLFGLIVRRDRQSQMRTLLPFTPVAVLAGQEDMALEGDDTVRPFTGAEARLLEFVMRSYLQRLVSVDNAMRNPLTPSQRVGTNDFQAVSAESEEERQLVAVQAYAANVSSEIQRRTIISLLEVPAPGSPLASAQADQLRRDRNREALSRSQNNTISSAVSTQQQLQPGVPGAPGTQQQAPQPGIPLPFSQQLPQPGIEAALAEDSVYARNFLDNTNDTDRFAPNREAQTFGQLVRQLDVDPLILINFLVDHRARLDGAVRGPGNYLVGPSVTLKDLVQAAGGTLSWADQNNAELITILFDRENGRGLTQRRSMPLRGDAQATYIVRPSDQIRFNQISTSSVGSVTVQGEVRNPGTFSILRGDRLSDVLARAGGLTEIAYPSGTVFLRQSAAQQEREGYQRAAREVQDQLAVAMTRVGDAKIDPAAFTSMQVFVQELRTQRALGRISIIADPSLLAARPDSDPLLESGDVIYLPQRPSTVAVLGQVMQPGSYPYRAGETIQAYIARAGGFARAADESQTFLVLPDGSARRWERSWFRFEASTLPPGTAIVVPRDVTPLDLRQTVIDVAQILSQLAVSVASIAVISNQ